MQSGSAPTTRRSRAEQREQTRAALVDAAERLFVRQGFHATSVDAVAAEAGFTKGAVYSNFAAKEELFLAVYERRAAATTARVRELLEELGPHDGLDAISGEAAARRGHEDGWLAVFFEFWAHVIRHPEHRARFAEIHAAGQQPFVDVTEELFAGLGSDLDVAPREWAVAMLGMQVGVSLERLVQPDVVDPTLGVRLNHQILRGLRPAERKEDEGT